MAEANRVIEAGAAPEAKAAVALSVGTLGPPRTLWGDAWRRFRRHKLAMAGTVVLLFFVLATLIGPSLYRVNREAIDFKMSMSGSTLKHPMGTDDLGRDLLARALFGGRVSIAVGVVAMLISILVGTTIGAVAGFFGGVTDHLLMRLTDMFLALPQLPLLLLTIFLFRDVLRKAMGPEAGIFLLIVSVIGLLNWMPTARIVRASYLSIKQKEFVEAARCLGVPRSRIMVRHILPNTLSPIIVSATLGVGAAIITESVLSFLGLGFPPDTPTWGRLLYDGQNFLELAPHMVIWPGLLICLTVLSINYMGDGLRDALDPRTRK
ncbi:MAG: ABC transporter permease [Chloroflexota bacterium]|nr:ABC transporter permease [Chloroflexota bacterium]